MTLLKEKISRLPHALNNLKYRFLQSVKLNNLKINRMLRAANALELQQLPMKISKLELSAEEYQRLLSFSLLQDYAKLPYAHTKPLEYLTTIKLLDPQDGDHILDAAGGEKAEYLQALRAFTKCKSVLYCQDSLLDGQESNGIVYIGGSIDSVPLPDGSLDKISCHHSFEHFRDDLDIDFIQEAIRLLKVGGKLVITPLFLTNEFAEIWNIEPVKNNISNEAITIFDETASFPGWGAFEGFARTYSPLVFKERILENLPSNCKVEIFEVFTDGKQLPDIEKNHHQPLLNAQMKTLLIKKI
jgi:SAM-dependent methyltransferase